LTETSVIQFDLQRICLSYLYFLSAWSSLCITWYMAKWVFTHLYQFKCIRQRP